MTTNGLQVEADVFKEKRMMERMMLEGEMVFRYVCSIPVNSKGQARYNQLTKIVD